MKMKTVSNHSDDFVQQVASFCRQHSLLQHCERALVALSGGADSVCLLLVLLRLKVPVVAAHCNFHLRGDESMRDERFVRSLCSRLGVQLEVVDFDVAAHMRATGDSVEMACRNLRYRWFETKRVEHGCDVIAVAHHADDNVETFFLNAVRGTGIAGLTAIHPTNGVVVRPLLGVDRRSIVAWLEAQGEPYVTDSTNLENDVKRNRLRNVVLPSLYEQLPEARRTLPLTISRMTDCYALYCEAVNLMRHTIAPEYSDSGEFAIHIDRLMAYDNAEMLLFEMLRPLGFTRTQCAQAIAAAAEGGGEQRSFATPSHTLEVKAATMRIVASAISAETDDAQEYEIRLDSEMPAQLPIGLTVELVEGETFVSSMCNGRTVIALDASVLACRSVVLRHWHQGDRFRPFGMRGTRLVSDLFTDLHLRPEAKRNAWILEADGQILWVVGYRAAAHFPVDRRSDRAFVLLSVPE